MFQEAKVFARGIISVLKRVVVLLCQYPCVCALGIHGGFLLGVRSTSGLAFYDWENAELVRRIEIQPKHVSQLTPDLYTAARYI